MRRFLIVLGTIVLVALVAATVVAVIVVATNWDGFLHVIGVKPRNPVSSTYNFWSGFGSDMGEVTLIAAVLGTGAAFWHKHNCHIDGCLRLSRHSYTDSDGHEHALCRKHHPLPRLTEASLVEHERKKKARKTATT